MIINNKFNYTVLTRGEENGVRKYNTPDGKKLPSVTTILSKTKDMTHLNDWVARVGAVEAERIKVEASSIGSSMHDNLERYILGKEMSGQFMAVTLAKVIIKHGLAKVNEVWGTEVGLYTAELYAGTTDLVGIHDGEEAIMDFKNSLKDKKREWIEDYFMQLAAYALSHNEMYGTNIKKGVVMIATREGKYQEFVIKGDEFTYYETMWANKVCEYYSRFANN